MTDEHRQAWMHLRRLRLGGLAALLTAPPVGVALGIFLQPLLDDSSPRVSVFIAVVPVVALVHLVTTFKCPACRKPFSTGAGSGIQLTNKRCVHCGLMLGETA